MPTPTLAVGLALSFVTGLCCVGVAFFIGKRAEDVAQRGAMRAFALWWASLGAYTFIGFVRDLSASLDVLTTPVLLTTIYVGIAPLTAGLWGLFYYLSCIFIGQRRLLAPSLALYGTMYVFFVYSAALLQPSGVQIRTWDVLVTYASIIPQGLGTVILALLFVPILVAVVAYASLIFRVQRVEQKVRIALVSLSFFAWFGGSFALVLLGLGEKDWAALVNRVLGLVTVLMVFIAYFPAMEGRRRRTEDIEQALATKLQEGQDG